MKKIISVIVLSLGFCFTANAQSEAKMVTANSNTEISPKDRAIADINELDQTVKLAPQVRADFTAIVNMRTEAVAKAKGYEEIVDIYEKFGKKLLSGLTAEQVTKLKANAALYKRLTSFSREK